MTNTNLQMLFAIPYKRFFLTETNSSSRFSLSCVAIRDSQPKSLTIRMTFITAHWVHINCQRSQDDSAHSQ